MKFPTGIKEERDMEEALTEIVEVVPNSLGNNLVIEVKELVGISNGEVVVNNTGTRKKAVTNKGKLTKLAKKIDTERKAVKKVINEKLSSDAEELTNQLNPIISNYTEAIEGYDKTIQDAKDKKVADAKIKLSDRLKQLVGLVSDKELPFFNVEAMDDVVFDEFIKMRTEISAHVDIEGIDDIGKSDVTKLAEKLGIETQNTNPTVDSEGYVHPVRAFLIETWGANVAKASDHQLVLDIISSYEDEITYDDDGWTEIECNIKGKVITLNISNDPDVIYALEDVGNLHEVITETVTYSEDIEKGDLVAKAAETILLTDDDEVAAFATFLTRLRGVKPAAMAISTEEGMAMMGRVDDFIEMINDSIGG